MLYVLFKANSEKKNADLNDFIVLCIEIQKVENFSKYMAHLF
jgi:hypothetical protein